MLKKKIFNLNWGSPETLGDKVVDTAVDVRINPTSLNTGLFHWLYSSTCCVLRPLELMWIFKAQIKAIVPTFSEPTECGTCAVSKPAFRNISCRECNDTLQWDELPWKLTPAASLSSARSMLSSWGVEMSGRKYKAVDQSQFSTSHITPCSVRGTCATVVLQTPMVQLQRYFDIEPQIGLKADGTLMEEPAELMTQSNPANPAVACQALREDKKKGRERIH